VEHSLPARLLLKLHNSRRIFSNAGDSFERLRAGLTQAFETHELRASG
jgi:hypothetical protein